MPPLPNDPNADQKRRHQVTLFRRADFAFAEATTLVRGVIKRGPEVVAGARIWADPLQPGNPPLFKTQSGAKGDFGLALRLPTLAPSGVPAPVNVSFHFRQGPDQRDLVRPISDGRTHIFEEPIDLIGNNTPNFIVP